MTAILMTRVSPFGLAAPRASASGLFKVGRQAMTSGIALTSRPTAISDNTTSVRRSKMRWLVKRLRYCPSHIPVIKGARAATLAAARTHVMTPKAVRATIWVAVSTEKILFAGPNVRGTATGALTLSAGRVVLRDGFSVAPGGRLTVATTP
jgi:hypothetical protein